LSGIAEGCSHSRLPRQRSSPAGACDAAAQVEPRRVGGAHHELVHGAQGDASRGRNDGVLEDCTGPRDVRRQLLRHQEQERHRAVAGRGRARLEHLRERRQANTEDRLPLVRDPEHLLQRPQVRH